MSYLESFTAEEKSFLVSVPYRVGLWVSESDASGGDEADEREMQALQAIITSYTEDFLKSEFVEDLMKETLKHRDKWPEWAKGLESVPEECDKALQILEQYLDDSEILSFKQNLMDISYSVAMAYREYDEQELPLTEKLQMHYRYFVSLIKARIQGKAPPLRDDVFSISKAEQQALNKLGKVLRMNPDSTEIEAA